MDKGWHSLSFQIALSWSLLLHLGRIVPAPNVEHLGGAWEGLSVFSVPMDWCIFASCEFFYLFKSTFRPWVKNESLPRAQEQDLLRERGGLKLLYEVSRLLSLPLRDAREAGLQ